MNLTCKSKNYKFLILLFGIVLHFRIFADASVWDTISEDIYNIYQGTAVIFRNVTDNQVTTENVNFYIFDNNNTDHNGILLDETNVNLLSPDRKVVFLIHGWIETRNKTWYEDMKNAFFYSYPEYIVIQVDWSGPAAMPYFVSSVNTEDVGKIIGNFAANLYKNYSFPLENILIVGHSLGGQTAGFVGKQFIKQTGEKLKRIVALDPAGPYFEGRPKDKILNRTDAEVVVAIHTDRTFGYDDPIGSIDIYMNNGDFQPGCKLLDIDNIASEDEGTIFCGHARSHAYFIEGLLNPQNFNATKCDSWSNFIDGLCDDSLKIGIGDLSISTEGIYHAETNGQVPFSKKPEGQLYGIAKVFQRK